MSSTKCSISSGGFLVKEETDIAIKKFKSIPTKPIPSGDIPINQFSELFNSVLKNLKNTNLLSKSKLYDYKLVF